MDFQQHIACPQCGTVNRVPDDRLGDGPKCGKCRHPLSSATPAELTDANFSALVERTSIPVVVDFWAPWCGPCKAMAPHFERAAAQLGPRIRFGKINTDDNPRTAGRFGIRSIPTLILFSSGRETARQPGAMDANALSAWIRNHT